MFIQFVAKRTGDHFSKLVKFMFSDARQFQYVRMKYWGSPLLWQINDLVRFCTNRRTFGNAWFLEVTQRIVLSKASQVPSHILLPQRKKDGMQAIEPIRVCLLQLLSMMDNLDVFIQWLKKTSSKHDEACHHMYAKRQRAKRMCTTQSWEVPVDTHKTFSEEQTSSNPIAFDEDIGHSNSDFKRQVVVLSILRNHCVLVVVMFNCRPCMPGHGKVSP